MSKLRKAAEAVLRAERIHRDALNGLGHPGEPHDRLLHTALAVALDIFNIADDCAACGGAQYGADYLLSTAYGDLREALGEQRLPWE